LKFNDSFVLTASLVWNVSYQGQQPLRLHSQLVTQAVNLYCRSLGRADSMLLQTCNLVSFRTAQKNTLGRENADHTTDLLQILLTMVEKSMLMTRQPNPA
jgi:hypothetical protein